MNKKWKDQPLHHKIISISMLLVSIAVMVLAIVQLLDLWPNSGYVYVPLMGINLLLQAYTQWTPNRKIAVFSLCAGVFVLICAICVLALL